MEATRVEQRTDFDKLIVDVETKQAIAPRDAVASAGTTLVELFGLARELNTAAEGIEIGPSPTDAALAADMALPIEDLDLTVRSYNCLKREGIHTVGELVARSEADLMDIRNFGAKSIDEARPSWSNWVCPSRTPLPVSISQHVPQPSKRTTPRSATTSSNHRSWPAGWMPWCAAQRLPMRRNYYAYPR